MEELHMQYGGRPFVSSFCLVSACPDMSDIAIHVLSNDD